MLKKPSLLAADLVLPGVLMIGCAGAPSADTQLTTPGPKATSPAPGTDWQQEWEKLLVEARKEGKVSIYANWIPENREALAKAFKERYGIDLEFTIFGRGAEIPVRVQAENRVGLYLADLFGAGTSIHVVTMKPQGSIGLLRPMLLLPEVLDEKAGHGRQR